jgi:hypothetical protein
MSRTERDLKALDSEDRLRSTLQLPPRPPVHIPATPKRTPEETAALVLELEEKLTPKLQNT